MYEAETSYCAIYFMNLVMLLEVNHTTSVKSLFLHLFVVLLSKNYVFRLFFQSQISHIFVLCLEYTVLIMTVICLSSEAKVPNSIYIGKKEFDIQISILVFKVTGKPCQHKGN